MAVTKYKDPETGEWKVAGSGGIICLLPQIIVEVETGITLTCTNGTVTLTGVSVDEKCVLNVTDYGEWIVSNGVFSEVVTVDIVKQYRVNMRIQLINYTMLYDYGDECLEVTGGWDTIVASGSASVTKRSDSMLLKYNSTQGSSSIYGARIYPENGFSKGEYDCLSVVSKCEYVYNNSGNYSAMISITGTKESTSGKNLLKATAAQSSKTYSVYNDIGQLYDVAYPFFYVYGANMSAYMVALFKSDDWQTLASRAGLTATSISNLLGNSATILANENAVEFMLSRCTGSFMANAIANSTFKTALNSSAYKEQIYANEHWAKFLAMVT